jgi:hypothetical protein
MPIARSFNLLDDCLGDSLDQQLKGKCKIVPSER